MDPTAAMGHLLGLAGACARAHDPALVVKSRPSVLLSLSDAEAAMLVRSNGEGVTLIGGDGRTLEPQALVEAESVAERAAVTWWGAPCPRPGRRCGIPGSPPSGCPATSACSSSPGAGPVSG